MHHFISVCQSLKMRYLVRMRQALKMRYFIKMCKLRSRCDICIGWLDYFKRNTSFMNPGVSSPGNDTSDAVIPCGDCMTIKSLASEPIDDRTQHETIMKHLEIRKKRTCWNNVLTEPLALAQLCFGCALWLRYQGLFLGRSGTNVLASAFGTGTTNDFLRACFEAFSVFPWNGWSAD